MTINSFISLMDNYKNKRLFLLDRFYEIPRWYVRSIAKRGNDVLLIATPADNTWFESEYGTLKVSDVLAFTKENNLTGNILINLHNHPWVKDNLIRDTRDIYFKDTRYIYLQEECKNLV